MSRDPSRWQLLVGAYHGARHKCFIRTRYGLFCVCGKRIY